MHENRHPSGLVQPLTILEWKWEVISMDFIMGLPNIKKKYYSIFVVFDKLSKATHFILVKSTYKEVHIADIFLKEIFGLHGIPKEIILDRDTEFTKNIWRSLFSGLQMQLNFSTPYHP